MTRQRFLLAALVALLMSGCNTQPRNVPCSNAGDCEAASDRFRYCTESRCVECLGDSGCGDGNLCTAGRCQIRCRDDRDCQSGERCREQLCGGG